MKAAIGNLLLGVLFLTMLGFGLAHAGTFGAFTYTVLGDNTIEISGYTGAGGDVVIPDAIGGTNVTSIGDNAFSSCFGLTSITIPDSVTSIGDNAFQSCFGLASVTIPVSVTNIGYMAFSSGFGLTNINVSSSNAFYSSLDGVLFNKEQTKLITIGGGKSGNTPTTVYYLPNTTGWNSTFADRTAVLWNPEFTALSLNGGSVSCTVTGSVDIPFAMEVSTNLLSGNWQRLSTTNLANGSMEFVDPEASTPNRFYRIVGY